MPLKTVARGAGGGGGSGTVTSVNVSGGTTGLTTTGGPITTAGTITLDGVLDINNGGTGNTLASASFDALAPTTTKGDIIVFDGSDNIRLGVGTNGYVLTADTASASGLNWTSVSGGGGSPGGSNTQVQFNDSGSFNGDSGLTFDKTTDALTVSGKVVTPHVDASSSAGGQLRNSSGTSQLAWGAGGGSNLSLEVATNINPVNASVSIAPTGTGTLTINPATAGTMNNMAIGGTTAAAGTFTNVTLNAQGDVRFSDSDSSNYVAFQGAAVISTNVTWTLPSADGSSGQSLVTNGSGTLSWSDVIATDIAGGAANQLLYQDTVGSTSFATAPTVTNSFLKWNGSAFAWDTVTSGTVTSVGLTMPTGFSVANSPVTGSGTLAVTTTLNGILKGNGSGFTTATSGTDYAPATTGANTELLANNGSGGFSNVVVGSGLSLSLGTLTATGGGSSTAQNFAWFLS